MKFIVIIVLTVIFFGTTALAQPGRNNSDSDKVIISTISSAKIGVINGVSDFQKALEVLESQNEIADIKGGKMYTNNSNSNEFVAEFTVKNKKTGVVVEYTKLVFQQLSADKFFVFFTGKNPKFKNIPKTISSDPMKVNSPGGVAISPNSGGMVKSSTNKEIPPKPDPCPDTYSNWEGVVGSPCQPVWLWSMYCPPIIIPHRWGGTRKNAQFIYQKRTISNCGKVRLTQYRWAHYDCSCPQ